MYNRNSSSLLTLCIIETHSKEHVNLDQNVSVIDSTPVPVYRVCRKKSRKRKEEGERSIAQCKKLHKHHNSLNFNCLYVCPVSMHVPKVIADCDDVSTEHILKHKNRGRL